MAYVQNPLDEETGKVEELDKPTEQVLSSPSGAITGSSGSGTGAAAGASSGSAPAGRRGFVNLRSYLDANKGENADNMSNKLVTGVSTAADSANTGLADVNNTFTTQTDAGTVKQNDDVLSNITADGNADTFRGMYNAEYKGPNSVNEIEGWGNAAGAVQDAGQRVDNLQSFGGTANELKTTYKRPDYGRGQVALDNYIVRDSAASGQFKDVKDKYNDLTFNKDTGSYNALQNYMDNSQTYANDARTTTDATREAARAAYETRVASENALIDAAAGQATTANDTVKTQYAQIFNPDGSIRDINALAKASGVPEESIRRMQDLDPTFNPASLLQVKSNATAGNYLTPEQRASMAALAGLIPDNNPFNRSFDPSGSAYVTGNVSTAEQVRRALSNEDSDLANERAQNRVNVLSAPPGPIAPVGTFAIPQGAVNLPANTPPAPKPQPPAFPILAGQLQLPG